MTRRRDTGVTIVIPLLRQRDGWLEQAVRSALGQSVPCEVIVVTSSLTPASSRTPLRDVYEALPDLEAKATYLTHFLLLDKSAVVAAGGLDESLGDAPGIDDYDLIWTLLERGATVELTGRPLYNYRVHEGERLTYRDRDEQLRVLGRILDKHRVTGQDRTRAIHQHARWFGRPEDVVAAEQRRGAGEGSSG